MIKEVVKRFLRFAIYVCMLPVVVLIMLSFDADSISATKDQSNQSKLEAVCRFIDKQFGRPVHDYVRDYGPILSSESHSLGTGERAVTAQLAKQITIGYSIAAGESRESLNTIKAKGIPAWRMLGLEIHFAKNVREVLGDPDGMAEKLLTYYSYGCSNLPQRILEIDLDGEVLFLYEIELSN